jgi:AAA ATPase domain
MGRYALLAIRGHNVPEPVKLTTAANPYSAGAGSSPPLLAGRDADLGDFRVLLEQLAAGHSGARSLIYSGLRGVGKTVLLLELESEAVDRGWPCTGVVEIGATTDFRTSFARMTHRLLRSLSRKEAVKERVLQALGVLKAFNVTTPGGFQLNIDVDAASGSADTGDMEEDLTELLVEVGEAARAAGVGVVYLVDEMQHLPAVAMGALCMAFHKISQRKLPAALVGAGLPSLPTQLRSAKPYAERLFGYKQLGRLPAAAARAALVVPAGRRGVDYDEEAVERILELSDGYPYFIQEYGRVVWEEADQSPITLADAELAAPLVQETLDEEFFDNRVDEATGAERRYMAAMSDLGEGSQRTLEITKRLGFETLASTSKARHGLIEKGLIYSPEVGYVDFTVPHFAHFMRRRYPLEAVLREDVP